MFVNLAKIVQCLSPISHFLYAVSDLCPQYWSYHTHTATCIRKFSSRKSFRRAKSSCESFRGAPSGDQPGWLVSIHDQETDDFVMSLLSYNQKAYIGLTKAGNKYVWLGQTSMNNQYRGWKSRFPRNSYYSYKYVLITNYGWEDQYYSSTKLAYVCQLYPSFSKPAMSCGSIEEGKRFPQLHCRFPVDETVGYFVKSIVKHDGTTSSLVCDSNLLCSSSDHLSGRIYSNDTSRSLTTEVTVDRPVSRTDNQLQWSCWYKFDNTPENLLVSRCKTQTYKLPQTNCTYNFPNYGGILFVCKTTGGYPKFSSAWRRETKRLGEQKGTHQEEKHGDSMYYKSTFMKRITDVSQGTHKIIVSIYPQIKFLDNQAKSKATLIQKIEVTISAPENHPFFIVENDFDIKQGRLTATEDETVILVCEVHGGIPQVSRVSVQCDGKHVRDSSGKTYWSYAGQKVRIELSMTRAMDQKVCTCKAQHVSKEYKKTASVTLDVRHASEIVSFQLNTRNLRDDVSVTQNGRIGFTCTANGNPIPDLYIYQFDSNRKTRKILRKTTNSSIAFDINKASCDISGTYGCVAENQLSTQSSERQVNLRVKCPPQPCGRQYGDREFYIVPGQTVSFQMCIYAYPAVHRNVRISLKDKSNLDENYYSAKFLYTNALETKGYITVNMSSNLTQLGNFTMKLYQSDWHYIDFSLIPYQKPSCPESLDILLVGSRFVTLSWRPAFDGITQTFTVNVINAKDGTFDKRDLGNDGQTISHNFTDLEPGSDYRFELNAKNFQEITECHHLVVNVTTQVLPVSAGTVGDRSSAGTVAAVTVALLIVLVVIILLGLVIYRKRRANKQPKMPIWLRPSKKEVNRFDEVPDSKRTSTQESNRRGQQEPVGDTYSKVNKPKKKVVEQEESVYGNKVAIELHTMQQSESSTGDPIATYFTLEPSNNNDRKASCYDWSDAEDSLDSMDDIAAAAGATCHHYNSRGNQIQELLKTDGVEYVNGTSFTGIYNNAAHVEDNRTSTSLPTNNAGNHNAYNSDVAHRGLRNEHNSKRACSSNGFPPKIQYGGTANGRKLVYVDVEFIPPSPGESKPQHKSRCQTYNPEEPVDYTSLSYDADISDSGTIGDNQIED